MYLSAEVQWFQFQLGIAIRLLFGIESRRLHVFVVSTTLMICCRLLKGYS